MNIPYICSGDYFIPDLKLPEETRPIGWTQRMNNITERAEEIIRRRWSAMDNIAQRLKAYYRSTSL